MGIFDIFKKKSKVQTSANKKLDKLFFKGTREAFDYSLKFFSTTEMKIGEAYIGLVAGSGNEAFINVIHNGSPQLVSVLIAYNRTGKQVSNKDLVLVGINEVNKPYTIGELAELEGLMGSDPKKAEAKIKTMSENSPIGEIVAKLKPVLDLSKNNFEYDE